jgi:hypothetical protein
MFGCVSVGFLLSSVAAAAVVRSALLLGCWLCLVGGKLARLYFACFGRFGIRRLKGDILFVSAQVFIL